MDQLRNRFSLGSYVLVTLLSLALRVTLCSSASAAARPCIDYNRDVKPILSENCYTCHGPDAGRRKAGLRLDQQDGALAELKSGNHAIIAGQADKSALVHRITTSDEDDRMPPIKSGKHLTEAQISTLKQWIAEGAQWKKHWSFIAPEKPEVPEVRNQRWPRNPVDTFILSRMEQARLAPEPEANKTALIRRLTFDLTGLPPTPEEVDMFLTDTRSDAYERLVERLLASPRYGVHMARYWLDVARYGDTHGLHLDNERSLWPYRDWVINAFNQNKPFDQFTVEQLAGDLLPNPTLEQKVATGFNRCNVTTSEGGAIDEEFYVRYAVDRTETAAITWMGLTAGCAVCHDHKFDPISQKEFYQLYAFFNSNTEKAMDGNALLPPPVIKLPTSEQKKKLVQLNKKLEPTDARIKAEVAKIKYKEPPAVKPLTNAEDFVWVDDDFPKGAKGEINGGTAERQWVETNALSGKRTLMRTDKGLAQDFFTGASQPLMIGKGDKLFAYVYVDAQNPPKAIMLQYHTTEWLNRANWGDENAIPYGEKGTPQKVLMGALPESGKWVRLEVETEKLGLAPGSKVDGLAFTQFGGTVYWDKAGILTMTPQEDRSGISEIAWEQQEKVREPSAVPTDVRDILKLTRGKRSKQQAAKVREYYLANVYTPARPTFEPIFKEVAAIKKERDDLENSLPSTMISQETEVPKPAHILKRGEYDKPGDPVQRNVPAVLPSLPPLPAGRTNYNRLDLARWLVSPQHPLTARVTVNRLWQQFFGTGLVKTAGDFGAQGEWPSHPELLDWLACEFRSGWDVKAFVRMLVTSATYRQDSRISPAKLQADPENRLLARGPRYRLDAEEIRDNALFVSGLLVEKMGGRSVRPYQPEGIWEAVGYTASNTAKFTQDHGDALYRRSIYTFWKRTAAPPTLITFDAPSRERYCVRRERTDTPLQALVIMNDPQYVEAARHLGERLLSHSSSVDEQLDYGFRLVTARHPTRHEMAVMKRVLSKNQNRFGSDVDAAKKLLGVGESPVNKTLNQSKLAAYTMIASLMLNLDETINKN